MQLTREKLKLRRKRFENLCCSLKIMRVDTYIWPDYSDIKTGIILSGLHEIINLHIQSFPADGGLFLAGNFLHWAVLLSTSDNSLGFPRCEALVTSEDCRTSSSSLVDLSSLEPRDWSASSPGSGGGSRNNVWNIEGGKNSFPRLPGSDPGFDIGAVHSRRGSCQFDFHGFAVQWNSIILLHSCNITHC